MSYSAHEAIKAACQDLLKQGRKTVTKPDLRLELAKRFHNPDAIQLSHHIEKSRYCKECSHSPLLQPLQHGEYRIIPVKAAPAPLSVHEIYQLAIQQNKLPPNWPYTTTELNEMAEAIIRSRKEKVIPNSLLPNLHTLDKNKQTQPVCARCRREGPLFVKGKGTPHGTYQIPDARSSLTGKNRLQSFLQRLKDTAPEIFADPLRFEKAMQGANIEANYKIALSKTLERLILKLLSLPIPAGIEQELVQELHQQKALDKDLGQESFRLLRQVFSPPEPFIIDLQDQTIAIGFPSPTQSILGLLPLYLPVAQANLAAPPEELIQCPDELQPAVTALSKSPANFTWLALPAQDLDSLRATLSNTEYLGEAAVRVIWGDHSNAKLWTGLLKQYYSELKGEGHVSLEEQIEAIQRSPKTRPMWFETIRNTILPWLRHDHPADIAKFQQQLDEAWLSHKSDFNKCIRQFYSQIQKSQRAQCQLLEKFFAPGGDPSASLFHFYPIDLALELATSLMMLANPQDYGIYSKYTHSALSHLRDLEAYHAPQTGSDRPVELAIRAITVMQQKADELNRHFQHEGHVWTARDIDMILFYIRSHPASALNITHISAARKKGQVKRRVAAKKNKYNVI